MYRFAGTLELLLGLIPCWLLFQAVHELGHVLAAQATGGTVRQVVLHPLEISRTDVSPNPMPLAVAWAGPLVGVILPAAIAITFRRIGSSRCRRYATFFAGFCLIANGLYIGVGSFAAIGDAGDLLRHGAPHGALLAFGASSTALGLWLWHRLTKKLPLLPRSAIPS